MPNHNRKEMAKDANEIDKLCDLFELKWGLRIETKVVEAEEKRGRGLAVGQVEKLFEVQALAQPHQSTWEEKVVGILIAPGNTLDDKVHDIKVLVREVEKEAYERGGKNALRAVFAGHTVELDGKFYQINKNDALHYLSRNQDIGS